MLKLSQRAQGLATEYVRYNEVSLNRDPFPYSLLLWRGTSFVISRTWLYGGSLDRASTVTGQNTRRIKRAMTRAYCCFRSILSLSHLFVALLIHKMLLQGCQEDIKRNSSGRTNHHNFFLAIFAGLSLILEKVGPT